jgi:hypothetical protein
MDFVPVPVSAILYSPLHGVVTRNARLTLVAAVRDVVAVVVGERPFVALAVVDDAVFVAVGGPFDD